MRLRKTYSNKPVVKPPSESIDDHIAEFLKRGGTIQQIPIGESGEEMMSIRRSAAMVSAQRMSTKLKQQSFGIVKAAQLLQVSHGWLAKQCDADNGPPFYMSGKAKQFLRDEVLKWWEERENE